MCTATPPRSAERCDSAASHPLLQHLQAPGSAMSARSPTRDAPHTPRGCPFQAWSLGELLRAMARTAAPRARRMSGSTPGWACLAAARRHPLAPRDGRHQRPATCMCSKPAAAPAVPAAAARLSRAGLQLAQADAAAGRRRATTCSRPTSAATVAPPAGDADYDGDLRVVRDAEPGARRAGAGACARPSGTSRRSSATTSARRWPPGAHWLRPDVFRSVVLMSAPFGGPPAPPSSASASSATPCRQTDGVR